MNKKKKLYCCFSVPLREYLKQNNIRYELCALNPNTKNMFWVYIQDKQLSSFLKEWSLKNN